MLQTFCFERFQIQATSCKEREEKRERKEEEEAGRRGEKKHVTVEVSVGAVPRYTSS